MVLVKPNWLPAAIESIGNSKCVVNIFDEEISVSLEDVFIPKLEVFKEGDDLQYYDASA